MMAVKSPEECSTFEKKLSKQLIGNYHEDHKKHAGDPDTQAGEHCPAHTPAKRVCRNRKKNKAPGEISSTSRAKCSGCLTEKGQINLCIDCFKDYHKIEDILV